MDTKRKLLVGVSGVIVTVYDIAKDFTQDRLRIDGTGDVGNAPNSPGVDYDPVSDRIVCWSPLKPNKVFGLDMDAKAWEVKQADCGPKVSRYAGNGVFGRWRYVPSVNAFIVVSDAGGNVFFYKYSAGLPSSTRQAPQAK